MTWLSNNWGVVLDLARSHLYLAGVPLVIGLVIALPLGWMAKRWSRSYPAIVTTTGLLYTIPSLALFVVMPGILGTKILDPVNVVVAMTVYKGLRRLVGVELPLAVPVIAAGLRVAAVSNVSIVSVASLLGVSQLGDLLIDGYNRIIWGELVTGILACVLLALALDALILVGSRMLTPWLRAAGGRA